jgi:hypothetical protein
VLNHLLMQKLTLEISPFRFSNDEVLALIKQMTRLGSMADADFTFGLIKSRAMHLPTNLRDANMYVQMLDLLY